MYLSEETILELKRKRGEQNIPVTVLAKRTGLSRWTWTKVLNGTKTNFQKSTVLKIHNWLEDL